MTGVSKQPEGMEEGFVATAEVEGAEGLGRLCPSTELKPAKEGSMKGGG